MVDSQSCVGNRIEVRKLGSFQDASFVGDVTDSTSASRGLLCELGSHTFVPISWMHKKQPAVSHSNAGSEIVSLDAGSRWDGLPVLQFWECVLETLSSKLAKGESLSVTYAKESFSLIHTLTIAYLNQLTVRQ